LAKTSLQTKRTEIIYIIAGKDLATFHGSNLHKALKTKDLEAKFVVWEANYKMQAKQAALGKAIKRKMSVYGSI